MFVWVLAGGRIFVTSIVDSAIVQAADARIKSLLRVRVIALFYKSRQFKDISSITRPF
jgi:hypothetical protein